MAKGDTPNYTRKQSDKDLARMQRAAKAARARGDQQRAREFDDVAASIKSVRKHRGWGR
ncbi:hypothetical protein OH802_09755 [Nocardioides sp. NBC_00850]|uniref:hypothetical protein n=1 Tax=Nocardioides sp. NBC_00850 TaxID=2976001 RepID=UPI00386745EC|nr:hypothetical protein OH802_09755 [Nocardioides sp. NBC_00850]